MIWHVGGSSKRLKNRNNGRFMKEIAAAMVNAQKNFAPALKTNTNPHFKSKYADLSACVEAVIDALNDAGIALIQRCHECDDGVIVETVFLHSSGESIESGRLHVPAVKSDPQGYGSALTYARRYSLMAACGIAPEDDDGNSASRDRKPGNASQARTPPTPSVSAANLIGNANIRPTSGAMESLTPGRKLFIEEQVVIAKEYLDMGDDVSAMALLAGFSDETEKVAAWTLFDSRQRSRLKAAAKAAAATTEAA